MLPNQPLDGASRVGRGNAEFLGGFGKREEGGHGIASTLPHWSAIAAAIPG